MTSFVGDPSLRVAAITFSALLCAWTGIVWLRRRPTFSLLEGSFWFGLCGLLVLLLLLREWDVQGALGSEAREVAKSGGWYGDRRIYQAAIAGGLVIAAAFVLLVALAVLGERRRTLGLPMLGAICLVCFLAVRALSLHQTDALFYRRHVHGVQFGVLLELGLVVMVGLSAVVAIWDRGPSSRPS